MSDRTSRRLSPSNVEENPPHIFPVEGSFEIYSEPVFKLSVGEQEEVVHMQARMVVETSAAARTENGDRYIPFRLVEWDAEGESRLLKGKVGFRLEENVDSRVSAGSAVADLPGRMQVRIRAGLLFNGDRVGVQDGMVVGNITSFPPAPGDLFTLDGKSTVFGDIKLEGLVCKCAHSS